MTTISQLYAEFAGDYSIDAVPGAVLDEMCWHALDTIGVCLAAVPLPYARMLADIVGADDGVAEATPFCLGMRLPARNTAFFNGCLGHGVDFDDTHLESLLHPTATVFPAMLALVESRKKSGRDLLLGMALGTEMMVRMGLAGGKGLIRHGIHPTSSCGAFGVALGTAWLAGLNQAQTVHALGIAGAHAGGLHESTIDGSWNKCIHSGLAVQAGMLASELAARGFTAPASAIDGSKGFFRSLAGDGEYDLAALTDGLGTRWEAARLAYKVYPCCQGIHAYADCALDIAKENELLPDDIEAIEVRVSPLIGVSLCEPVEEKAAPPTAYGAKFSMPYVVASALIDGRVDHATFLSECVSQPWRIALARKVRCLVDNEYGQGMALRGHVHVSLRDGRQLAQQTAACRGTPENPWAHDAIIQKFLSNAVPVIGDQAAMKLVELIPSLGDLDDLSPITTLLAIPARHVV